MGGTARVKRAITLKRSVTEDEVGTVKVPQYREGERSGEPQKRSPPPEAGR
jgi:hypothetical protein